MSRKRKNYRKRATKQHGSDTLMRNTNGTLFLTAAVHQGRVTRVLRGPDQMEAEHAVAAFNDGLYRNIEVSGVEPETI